MHILLLGFITFKQFRDAQTRKTTLILPFLLSVPYAGYDYYCYDRAIT